MMIQGLTARAKRSAASLLLLIIAFIVMFGCTFAGMVVRS